VVFLGSLMEKSRVV